jgi:hypothetical protein
MERRRWLNQGQPQTLVIACFLLYINAAFAVLSLLRAGSSSISLGGWGAAYFTITIGGGILGGYGIANERKWGYFLALFTAFAPFALALLAGANPFGVDAITLLFEIALVALLLHTQSREYEKVWFK